MRLGLHLGMTRRHIASVAGPVEVPADVIAWVDFRQGGLEYVAGETEVSEGAPTWSASGASFDGTDDALRWTYGSTAFSSLPAGDFCLEMFGLSLANEAGSILGNDNDAGSTVAGCNTLAPK